MPVVLSAANILSHVNPPRPTIEGATHELDGAAGQAPIGTLTIKFKTFDHAPTSTSHVPLTTHRSLRYS